MLNEETQTIRVLEAFLKKKMELGVLLTHRGYRSTLALREWASGMMLWLSLACVCARETGAV